MSLEHRWMEKHITFTITLVWVLILPRPVHNNGCGAEKNMHISLWICQMQRKLLRRVGLIIRNSQKYLLIHTNAQKVKAFENQAANSGTASLIDIS